MKLNLKMLAVSAALLGLLAAGAALPASAAGPLNAAAALSALVRCGCGERRDR